MLNLPRTLENFVLNKIMVLTLHESRSELETAELCLYTGFAQKNLRFSVAHNIGIFEDFYTIADHTHKITV